MEIKLYLASNQGVIRGSVSGQRWEIIGRSLSDQNATSIAATGKNLIVGTEAGIFRSSDAGESWSAANEGLRERHVRWLKFHPDNMKLAMAGFEPAAIYVSEDGARAWHERPEVAELREKFNWMLPYSPESGCVRGFYLQSSRAYAAVEVGGLLRSDNWGQTWSLVPASDGIPTFGPPKKRMIHPDVHSVNGHPDSPDLIFAPTGGGFYVSEDGGESFVRRYPPCYCRAVWADPADKAHLILGAADGVDRNGRIMETMNGGESWGAIDAGLETPWPRTMVERLYSHKDSLLALTSDGRLFFSEIGQWKWVQIFKDVPSLRALAFEDS
jgi:photosystem II stability/assembly factor-like uncharacterized protein